MYTGAKVHTYHLIFLKISLNTGIEESCDKGITKKDACKMQASLLCYQQSYA